MVSVLTREISQSILWAVLFTVICALITFVVRKFLGALFVSGDGKTFLGVFDGLLGMLAATALTAAFLVIFCGLIYPVILMSDGGDGISRIYPYLLDSALVSRLAGIYQIYVAPWGGMI
jgi:branched-subunit amino acid transport protein